MGKRKSSDASTFAEFFLFLTMDFPGFKLFFVSWFPDPRSLRLMDTYAAAWVANAVSVAIYLHYVTSVVQEIAGYLGIMAFSITPRKSA